MTIALLSLSLLLGASAYLIFSYMKHDMLQSRLEHYATRVLPSLTQGDQDGKKLAAQVGSDIRVWHLDRFAQAEHLPAEFTGLSAGFHERNWRDEPWQLLVQEYAGQQWLFAQPTLLFQQRQYEFGLLMAACVVFFMLLIWITAPYLAALVARPLVKLVRTLTSTMHPGEDLALMQDDEMRRLLAAFNAMKSRLEELMLDEREMTANLGHELNTALGAIRTEAEMLLLLQGEELTPIHKRLQNVIKQTDVAAAAVRSAHSFIHEDGQLRSQLCSVRRCVDDAWTSVRGADEAKLTLDNQLEEDFILSLEVAPFLIVARNLMQNAVDHAQATELLVTQAGAYCIAFIDDGKGIPAQDLGRLFERHYHQGEQGDHSKERGLGLSIARQLCLYHGWDLSVSSYTQGPVKGTRFLLTFAA